MTTTKGILREQRETEKQQAQIEVLSAAVPSVIVTTTCLVKAIRAARRGNYPRATFFAVMWMGSSNNANAQMQVLREKHKGKSLFQ